MKAIFPEDYYVERKFEGLSCRVFKPLSDGFTHTKILTEWLEGAFDAMDKKYVYNFILIALNMLLNTL